MGALAAVPSNREIVDCSNDCSPLSAKNCLGLSARDSGHKRVPDPPARMTGTYGCANWLNGTTSTSLETNGYGKLFFDHYTNDYEYQLETPVVLQKNAIQLPITISSNSSSNITVPLISFSWCFFQIILAAVTLKTTSTGATQLAKCWVSQ